MKTRADLFITMKTYAKILFVMVLACHVAGCAWVFDDSYRCVYKIKNGHIQQEQLTAAIAEIAKDFELQPNPDDKFGYRRISAAPSPAKYADLEGSHGTAVLISYNPTLVNDPMIVVLQIHGRKPSAFVKRMNSQIEAALNNLVGEAGYEKGEEIFGYAF